MFKFVVFSFVYSVNGEGFRQKRSLKFARNNRLHLRQQSNGDAPEKPWRRLQSLIACRSVIGPFYLQGISLDTTFAEGHECLQSEVPKMGILLGILIDLSRIIRAHGLPVMNVQSTPVLS